MIEPRRVDATEAAGLAELERRAAAAPWSEEAVRTALSGAVTRALRLGDPPVGHVLYTVVADEGEILSVAVVPEARRRGHGRALLLGVHADWRRAGVRTGWLEVRCDNGPARALYAGLGWVEVATRRGYYADGTDAVVCRWSTCG